MNLQVVHSESRLEVDLHGDSGDNFTGKSSPDAIGRVVPSINSYNPPHTHESLRDFCESPIPANHAVSDELASAGRAGRVSNQLVTAVGPTPTPSPLIDRVNQHEIDP